MVWAAMPDAAINPHSDPLRGKDDVNFKANPWNGPPVLPKSQAETMERRA